MDPRLLPLATFECERCGEQVTVRLSRHLRRKARADRMRPWPRCSCSRRRFRMVLVQVDYGQGGAS